MTLREVLRQFTYSVVSIGLAVAILFGVGYTMAAQNRARTESTAPVGAAPAGDPLGAIGQSISVQDVPVAVATAEVPAPPAAHTGDTPSTVQAETPETTTPAPEPEPTPTTTTAPPTAAGPATVETTPSAPPAEPTPLPYCTITKVSTDPRCNP